MACTGPNRVWEHFEQGFYVEDFLEDEGTQALEAMSGVKR